MTTWSLVLILGASMQVFAGYGDDACHVAAAQFEAAAKRAQPNVRAIAFCIRGAEAPKG